MHLQICVYIYIYTDRALESETCGFSKKTKITSRVFTFIFPLQLVKSLLLAQGALENARLASVAQYSPVWSLWGPAWGDGE